MTKFADELFTDLMAEHGPALERVTPPVRRMVPRPVWLAAGVVGMAGAVTAGMAVFGSGTPAYAVTPNGDGTVTISINRMDGVDGANGTLRSLGDRVVVVPVRPGCPGSIGSLKAAKPAPHQDVRLGVSAQQDQSGTITVDAHGVPAGDTMVVGVLQQAGLIEVTSVLITGPAPSCVGSLLPPGKALIPASGSSSGH